MVIDHLYLGNVLSSFETGVQLDLRVKLAIEFLKSGNADGPVAYGVKDEQLQLVQLTVAEKATYCLDLAETLISQAQERGLVKDLPDDDELTQPLRKHLRRAVRAQVYQQSSGPAIAAEESPVVRAVQGKRVIEN